MTNQADEKPVNIMTELRLRMWARKNYIPANERCDDDWHPIVADEMRRRDTESEPQRMVGNIVMSSGIVPLEPSRHESRLDQAHRRVPEPKLGTRSSGELDQQLDADEIFIPHYA